MKLRKVLLSATVAAIPVNVLALGLGNAELSSALNEPLEARISLYSVDTELEDINAGLASVSDFRKAGLEWSHNLSELRFRIATGADGKPYIAVTSRQPIREPFLNFLLEVNWPTGRLLREYTVLLDPPVYGAAMEKAVTPVVTTAEPAPRPAAAAPARDAAPAAPAPTRPQPAGPRAGANEYGPVERNETLWSIASAVRPEGTSVQQTMLALVDANPEAFINGNVNALREGVVLRVPARDEVAGRSQAEALEEVKRQYAAWQQQRLTTTPGPTPAGQVARPGAGEAVVDEDARLKLVSPGTGERGAGAGSAQALREDLALTEEELDSTKAENAELKSRLAETEAMLEDFQRLLQLKDENIAELQRRLREQAEAPGPEALPGAEPPAEAIEPTVEELMRIGEAPVLPDEAEAGAPVEEPMPAEEPAVEEPSIEELLAPGGEPVLPEEEPMAAEEEAPPPPVEAPAVAEAPEPPAAEPPPAPPKRAPILPPPAAPEPAGLLDSLPVSPTVLGAGLGGILLLLLGGLFLRKKRAAKEGEDELPESIAREPLAAPAAEASVESTESTAQLEAGEVAPEEPRPDERTSPEAFTDTMIQEAAAREDDALDEVNVYLAYERYDQAEQLVRKALEDHPERESYHLKLLEIHHTAKNVEGFRRDAAVLAGIAGAGSPAMAQAMGWWDELAPGTPLFPEEGEAAGPQAAPEAEVEKTQGAEALTPAAGGLDFDLTGDESAQEAAEDAAAGSEADMDIDFDLGLEGEEEVARAEEAATDELDLELEGGEEPGAGGDLELDFDLGESEESRAEEGGALDLDLGEGETAEESRLDLEFDFDETEEPKAEEAGGLDFDLGETEEPRAGEAEGLDFDLGETEEPRAGEAEGLDFDLGEEAEDRSETATGEQPAMDFDLDETEPLPSTTIQEAPLEAPQTGEGDMDLDLGEGEEPRSEEAEGLDFDLGEETPAAGETPTLEEEEPRETERLDTVALDNLDMDLGEGGPEQAEGAGESELDIDLGFGEEEPARPAEAEDESGLDLDFSDFGEPAAGEQPPESAAEKTAEEGPEIDFDLDLGFDEDEEPARTLALGQEMEGDIDEVGTKLDLAQAYIDMGNADGARTILNEVLSEGDDQQKTEARQLLDKLE